MKHYKFDKKTGLIDETGKQILQIVKNNCSEKFRVMAGRELANKLNTIEQSKKKCPHCGSTKIRVFDADNDYCENCEKLKESRDDKEKKRCDYLSLILKSIGLFIAMDCYFEIKTDGTLVQLFFGSSRRKGFDRCYIINTYQKSESEILQELLKIDEDMNLHISSFQK